MPSIRLLLLLLPLIQQQLLLLPLPLLLLLLLVLTTTIITTQPHAKHQRRSARVPFSESFPAYMHHEHIINAYYDHTYM